jgi:hypothetical protein
MKAEFQTRRPRHPRTVLAATFGAAATLTACQFDPRIEIVNDTGQRLLVHYKDDGEIAYWDDKIGKIEPGGSRTWFLHELRRGPLVHVTGGDCDYAYVLASPEIPYVPTSRVARVRIGPDFVARFFLIEGGWDRRDAPLADQVSMRPSSKTCGADRRSLKITTEEERALY